MFSFVRIVTDQPKLTSTLTFVAAVGLAAPILLGAAATLREMRTFAEAGVPGT